ncbi:BRO1 domain protein [Raphanus sativus]|nr:BRO1 domain protein [Raphanus sativus]KAJ4901784.1 BRO1 domain protein [Raphanus sativus]
MFSVELAVDDSDNSATFVVFYTENQTDQQRSTRLTLEDDDLEALKNFPLILNASAIRLPPPEETFTSLITKLSAFWRHPTSPEKHNVNAISFQWYDAFKQNQKATQQNIYLEKAGNRGGGVFFIRGRDKGQK